MNRRERRVAARKSQTASNGTGADSPAALQEAALRHMRNGRHLDAQVSCQRALALDAGHAGTLQLMGLLSLHAKQYDAAVEWVGRANRADPRTDYLASLGTALEAQGLHEEALKAFDQAVQIRPDDAELWTQLGNVLVLLQRAAPAMLSYQRALTLNPRYWHAAYNYALVLLQSGRLADALGNFNLCDGLQPNHAATLQKRAETLCGLGRFEDALSDGRRAHALDLGNADICNEIGVALRALGRYDEALEWFERAIVLRPQFARAFDNRAAALGETHRFAEAVTLYRNVKAIDPDNAGADWNLSLIYLLCGDFEAGWPAREARWKVPSLPGTANYPKFPQPMWLGEENIAGKTIVVCADEGLGDTIQFVRYVPMLAALGARVILLPQEPLVPLLSGMPGVSQCLAKLEGTSTAFDVHCPVCSLPFAFRTQLDSIPAEIPYLPPPVETRVQLWEARLGARNRLRVGLVWSGNPQHNNDHNRSIPLRMFSRLFDANASFVSLQKDPRPEDRTVLRERTGIVDLTEHFTDFSETAALISCLDLVITVDTSMAHLAGALGCPTWILLPYTPDWRWLLDRCDSPWYPTVRLFRQTETHDYGIVLDRVRTELVALIAGRQPLAGTREFSGLSDFERRP
ncbi:tetratricopeptide repeat protein [Bradyrhizobium sp.]|uniref:tetratricopeptide repeat protein n=1 Tax=Bradyrhizobium sp. TaxID=376 RepID=UPI003C499B28